jgi:membrane peptidoglycan carboxypeptidase
MGYTKSLVVGVWAGNNDNTPMQKHAGSILAAAKNDLEPSRIRFSQDSRSI